MQHAAARDRRGGLVDCVANERNAHRNTGERRHVGGGRVRAERVEAVRTDEVRVCEAEVPRLGVHQLRESGQVGRCRERKGDGGVVGGLDQRAADQVRDGELLPGLQLDALLPDLGDSRVDGHDV